MLFKEALANFDDTNNFPGRMCDSEHKYRSIGRTFLVPTALHAESVMPWLVSTP